MVGAILVVITTLLLLACRDVGLCVSFYLGTNRGTRPSGTVRERPRSLSPDQVALRHSLLFLVQKVNYYWQAVTALGLLGRLYREPRRTTDRDVALLIIDTSLVTWSVARPLPDGGVAVDLSIEGFAFPLLPDRHDNRLAVAIELRHVAAGGEGAPAIEARTLRFELNGEPIDAPDEQLSILAIMISSVTHPVIHSFNNRLYGSHTDARLAGLDDLFLHGQYLNAHAWLFPGLLFRIRRARGHHWYREVLAFNAELPLPAHHHATLAPLLPYSRSVRFLMSARRILSGLCRRYELPVDGESLFICTILHAVDHTSCDRHTRGHLMRHEKLPNEGLFNLIALLYYRPAQHFWTNLLKDKQAKHPLYEELYRELHRLDPGLADQVTLSISY